MRNLAFACLLFIVPGSCLAQLTPEQKQSDFRVLVGNYDKYYAPYEWKKQLFNFDALLIGPWLDRVTRTTNDLDFYELCVEYVASLNDTHDSFGLPSDFVARLGFTTDLYDNKLLVDSINRTLIPIAKYPIVTGDELVSIDGTPVEQLLSDFSKYGRQSNPRSTRRLTAARLTIRPQSIMPHAADVGDSATVVIRSNQDGSLTTYTIPWSKTGTPIGADPVPNPTPPAAGKSTSADLPVADDPVPDYLQPLVDLQYSGTDDFGLNGYGARAPIFALPSGFVQRRGLVAADFFYSGTFSAGGYKIGYIRIPNYAPPSTVAAMAEGDGEIAYFQANTDGLVVDEMRNTGGSLCFGEDVMTRLATAPFQSTSYLIRVFYARLAAFYSTLQSAKAQGAAQWIIDTYQAIVDEMTSAYKENRGLTGPLPICTPSITRYPNVINYTKPVMMMIDEFSTSTADSVPAMFQDAGRGPLFGWRSNGAGGNNTTFAAGGYSEGSEGMTLALQVRPNMIATADYPASRLIENVGVRPDIQVDYMTKDNLLQQGKPYVDAFTAAIVDLIKKSAK
jgi:Peptidase family S41